MRVCIPPPLTTQLSDGGQASAASLHVRIAVRRLLVTLTSLAPGCWFGFEVTACLRGELKAIHFLFHQLNSWRSLHWRACAVLGISPEVQKRLCLTVAKMLAAQVYGQGGMKEGKA